MAKYLKSIVLILKGVWIGGTMTVPGVSGGSMAMLLGIYDKLIYSVSTVFKKPKQSLMYLSKVLIGGVIGIVLFVRLMDSLLLHYPMPTRFFFLGAVLGGIPVIFKSAEVKKLQFQVFLFPLIGILAVYGISLIPTGLFAVSKEISFSYILLQLLGGFIIAVALVLPGISVSHMLLMLGLYETIIRAVKDFDILILVPLMAGVLIGTFITSKILEGLFERHKLATYLTVFGFLLGSLVELFPGIPKVSEFMPSILTLLLGFAMLFGISRV